MERSGLISAPPGSLTPMPLAVPASVVVLSDLADAERLRPAWESLQQRSSRNEITQSPDWILTWWRTFGQLQGRQLRLGLFQSDGCLIGLAPLLRRRHWYGGALPFRRLELLASGEPDEHGIFSNHLAVLAERGCEKEVAFRFVSALLDGAFGSWDEVVLPMMSGDTPMPDLLVDAFRSAGIAVEKKETALAPYTELLADWETYLKGLSKHKRKTVQRSLKAVEAWSEGTLQLQRATTKEELEEGKAILVRLHHGRWAGDGQAGVFRSPLFLQFHDTLMHRLLERDELELLWLTVRGEPIAAVYGMVRDGKLSIYQTGRRLDVPEQLRPGFTLMALAIRRAIEAGYREFDLLAEDMRYKRQLAPMARPLVRVRAVRRCWVESLRRGGHACRRLLRRNATSIPHTATEAEDASE